VTFKMNFYDTSTGELLCWYATNSYQSAMSRTRGAIRAGLTVKLLQNGNTMALPDMKY